MTVSKPYLWCGFRSWNNIRKNILSVSWCVLGVVANLRTIGSLELQLGGLVGAESLAVGTDPLLGRSLLVDLVELFLSGTSLVGGLGGTGGKDVTANKAEILGEFSDLRVGDEEGEEDTEVSGGCLSVYFRARVYCRKGEQDIPWSASFCKSSPLTGMTPFWANLGSAVYEWYKAFWKSSSAFFSWTIARRVSMMSLVVSRRLCGAPESSRHHVPTSSSLSRQIERNAHRVSSTRTRPSGESLARSTGAVD